MMRISQRLASTVKRTYNAAEVRVLNKTSGLPLPSVYGTQTIGAKSHCIYKFECNCGESYIGRTDRRLISRIREHVPKWVEERLNGTSVDIGNHRPPTSSIGRHLLATGHAVDLNSAFSIVLHNESPRFLLFAEAVAINRSKPSLCVQKQFVFHLRLPWS